MAALNSSASCFGAPAAQRMLLFPAQLQPTHALQAFPCAAPAELLTISSSAAAGTAQPSFKSCSLAHRCTGSARGSMEAHHELRPLELPAAFSAAWCSEAAGALNAASQAGPAALKAVLPADVVCTLLERCQQLLQAEPTLLEVRPKAAGQAAEAAWPLPTMQSVNCILRVSEVCAAAMQGESAQPCSLPASPPLCNCPTVAYACLCTVQVAPPEGAQVVVVGDTHGQFHDVCRM